MLKHPQAPVPSESMDIPPSITQLTNREADQMLAQAEKARRAEIDEYWSLCHSDPVRAAHLAAGSAPIVRDLSLLAACRSAIIPRASEIESLFKATERLLAVNAVRDSLLDEFSTPLLAGEVDCFWEDGRIVGLKLVNQEPVMVLRYFGPMLNPGTIPATALTDGDHWSVECHRESDGNGGEVECPLAYVVGAISADGTWRNVALDLSSRSALMRDLKAMEALADRGMLTDEYFDAKPLVDFPTRSELLIAQLNAHKSALRCTGAMSMEWQAIVEARTSPLLERLDRLQKHMKRMEDEMYRIRCRLKEVEACALEDETGFARGDKIKHKSTGHEGILEIVNPNFRAQFRLCDTTMYVTEDIRRGEWELMPASPVPME